MGEWRGIDYGKPARWIIFAVVVVFVWWGTSEANADTRFAIGPTQVGTDPNTGVMVTVTERLKDRYDFTLGWASQQEFDRCEHPSCHWVVKQQIFVGTELVFKSPWTDNLRLGIGPYYFQNADRIVTSNFRVGIHLEYRFDFWDRTWGLEGRHFSSGGSSLEKTICRPSNDFSQMGFMLDPLDPRPEGYNCKTNDWNTGLDSFLRLTLYF